jgi:hypothetical protein
LLKLGAALLSFRLFDGALSPFFFPAAAKLRQFSTVHPLVQPPVDQALRQSGCRRVRHCSAKTKQ